MTKKLTNFLLPFLIMMLIFTGCAKTTADKNTNVNKSAKEKSAEDLKKAQQEQQQKADEEQQRKDAEEKNKKLEDLYQQAYKAFIFDKNKPLAISTADQIIQQDPNFYKAYSIKGIALCYSSKYQEGMDNIDKALALKPDFGYGLFNKALAYELYGHYDEALVWYDKALSVENYVWSWYGKASIYGRRGDVANTVKYLSQAIALEPGVKDEARQEKDFNPVRNSKEFQDLIK